MRMLSFAVREDADSLERHTVPMTDTNTMQRAKNGASVTL
jgi:hypothetical protein